MTPYCFFPVISRIDADMNWAAANCKFLSRALRVDATEADNAKFSSKIKGTGADRKQVFQLTNHEQLTTALAASLRRRGVFDALPQAVRGAPDRRHFMGSEIKSRVKAQAIEICQ